MAKAKTRRAAARKAAGSKRAKSPARSRKVKSRTVKTTAKKRGARSAARARKPVRRSAKSRAARPAARKTRRSAPARSARKRPPARKAATRTTPSRTVARKATGRKAATRPAPSPKPPVQAATVTAPPKTPKPVARRPATPLHGKPPALDRERRRLPEADIVPSPPSSLDLRPSASAARTGQAEIAEHLADHTESGPELTAGDVDASWESAYSTGDEAPGGDNPTPDQDVVDDIGRSLGLTYEDNEELKGADKITERDRHRWELDPASAEDYKDR